MPDVLFLTVNDWANTGFRFCESLKTQGVDAMMLKKNAHKFGYPRQAALFETIYDIMPYADQAKVLHYTASMFFDPGIDIRNKKIIFQHGGTTYREQHEQCNSFMNPISDFAIIQEPDLCGLGARNEVYITYPVDTGYIQPVFKPHKPGKRIFAHHPSNSNTKGSDLVFKVAKTKMDQHENMILFYNEGNVTWPENLGRVSLCDVYIETLQPEIRGRKFGTWGNAACEAAALGKIVITNDLYTGFFEREYGRPCEWIIANDPNELSLAIDQVMDMSDAEFQAKKEACRQQIEDCHSFEATGKRLMDRVYGYLL